MQHRRNKTVKGIATNDVLPLEAARRHPIAIFGPRETSDLISMVSFTFGMRRRIRYEALLAPLS